MRIFAHFISYLFHPIFMVSYGVIFLYLINPYLFGVTDPKGAGLIFINVFLLTVFFPLISISLMKSLGLIKSIQMKERTDRIGPLISTAIFYLWLFVNIFRNPIFPNAFSIFVLGAVISLFLAFFINNFSKVSLHSIGVGGALFGAILIKLYFSYDVFPLTLGPLGNYSISVNLFLILVILMVGLVATSRLLLKSHKPSDVYGGLSIGVFSQLLATMFLF